MSKYLQKSNQKVFLLKSQFGDLKKEKCWALIYISFFFLYPDPDTIRLFTAPQLHIQSVTLTEWKKKQKIEPMTRIITLSCLYRSTFCGVFRVLLLCLCFPARLTSQPTAHRRCYILGRFHSEDIRLSVLPHNRKLFFNSILHSTAAAAPSTLFTPSVRDAVLLPQPTDHQTAGKIILDTSDTAGHPANSCRSPLRHNPFIVFTLNVHNAFFFWQLLVSPTQHPEKHDVWGIFWSTFFLMF